MKMRIFIYSRLNELQKNLAHATAEAELRTEQRRPIPAAPTPHAPTQLHEFNRRLRMHHIIA